MARKLYRTGKWTRLQLCEHLGVKASTMKRFLQGLPKLKSESKRTTFTEQQEDVFLEQVKAGKSLRRIAAETGTGCAPSTISAAVDRARKREGGIL